VTACFALCYERDARLGMQTFRLRVHVHNFNKLYKSAMLVQSQNPEIFQVAERNIKNQKMIDNRGNAKIALP
jgi:hypothetical protein